MTPARSTDDLPLPDAPTTATSLPAASRPISSSTTLFAPEEVVAVLGFERQQTAVRALASPASGAITPARLERRRFARARHATEPVRPEVDELAARGQMPGHQLGGDRRQEDLAAVGLAADSRREVDRWRRRSRSRGARPHRCGYRTARRREDLPATSRPTGARVAASAAVERTWRRVEHRDGGIASPFDLRNRPPRRSTHSAISSSCRTSACAIAAGSESHIGARPLDVRQAERDHAGGQRLRPARAQPLDQLPRRRRSPRRVVAIPRRIAASSCWACPGRCPPTTAERPMGAAPVSSANAVAASA